MSRYQDIANDIEKNIIEKKYTRKLPEQFELAQKYQTSRVTIVHALKILQNKKLIRTVKGHGTFITSKSIPDIFLILMSMSIPALLVMSIMLSQ